MTNPTADRVAATEGREARKAGKPRASPYQGINLLRVCHDNWLVGWDAMDAVLSDGKNKWDTKPPGWLERREG